MGRLRSIHSHGPFNYDGGSTVTRYWNGAERVIASVQQRLDWHENLSCSHDEAEANGYLLAAAPDLLEALQAVQEHISVPMAERDSEWHSEGVRIERAAKAAIAKATGQ